MLFRSGRLLRSDSATGGSSSQIGRSSVDMFAGLDSRVCQARCAAAVCRLAGAGAATPGERASAARAGAALRACCAFVGCEPADGVAGEDIADRRLVAALMAPDSCAGLERQAYSGRCSAT